MVELDKLDIINIASIGLLCFFLIAGFFGGMRITARSLFLGVFFGFIGSILQFRYHYTTTSYPDTVVNITYPMIVASVLIFLPSEEIAFFGPVLVAAFLTSNMVRESKGICISIFINE